MIYKAPVLGPEEEAALRAIERVRKQLRYNVAEPRRWVGSVRRVLAARAIQGSNSIEGYNVSVEDAIAAIEGEDLADVEITNRQAISGYCRAMTYVISLAQDEHFEYSAALIRSLHFMMTEYSLEASPGRWRPGPIYVRNDATGDVVYEAPEHDRVPGMIDELVKELESDTRSPAIVRAAMAHLNLVMIHPFRDGNGRMSRCIQTLVLAREKILTQEFSSIEEYLGRNTARYYDVLACIGQGSWNPERDAREWVRFCLEAHYVQAESILRRLRESSQMWNDVEGLRTANGLSERTTAALFDAAIGLRVRNSGYRALLRRWGEQVSNQVATTDLRAMVNAGLLRAHGRNRGAYYDAAEPLINVRARARAARQQIDTSSLFSTEAD
ncbi:MAG: Fic family protein [Actinomycetota bacterium]|nr:Fic family protein [Actinomycetota bacterium]